MSNQIEYNLESLKSLCAIWPDERMKIGVSFDTYHELRSAIDIEMVRDTDYLKNPEHRYLDHFQLYINGTLVIIFAQDDITRKGLGLR